MDGVEVIIRCAGCELPSGECRCDQPRFRIVPGAAAEAPVPVRVSVEPPKDAPWKLPRNEFEMDVHAALELKFKEPTGTQEMHAERVAITQAIQREIDKFIAYLHKKYMTPNQ